MGIPIPTGIIPVGSVWATMGTIADDEFPVNLIKDDKALGRKLVHDWREQIVPPDTEHRRIAFMERVPQLMMYRKDEWPFEYEYWQKKGQL